jgi:hypothetical protein
MNIIRSIKKIVIGGMLAGIAQNSFAQLTVNSALTPTYLVQNVLVGTGVTVSGVTYTGDATARGSFNGVASDIGFASGILLATGAISNAIGPNNSPSQTTDFGTISSDPQLTAIASGPLHDAAILEFDFIPLSDSLKFRYVFGSEEYPEFVCSTFNDVFGFFISGPNPAGGSYANQNIAIIPGTGLAVAINTINPGVAGASSGGGACTSLAYSSDYYNNGNGLGTGGVPDGATIQYDGFTIPLTAKAAVVCGQTYHIKIAIADVGDGAYDSGVFLEAGSFSSQTVNIVPKISYGGANDSVLYEGCGEACIYFIRTSNLASIDTVNIGITGTATNGVDYNTGVAGVPLPSQIIFAPGQDSIKYCISAVAEGVPEGLETILLSIIQTGSCITTTTNATIYIGEYQPLTITTRDTTLCNTGGTVVLDADVTGGVQPYIYSWTHGAAPIADPTVTVTSTTTYVVTVNDACTGSPDPTPAVVDSAVIKVLVFAPLVVNAGNDVIICPGDAVNLAALVTGGGVPYIYNWSSLSGTDILTSHHTATTSAIINGNDEYSVSVVDICGNTQTDQVIVSVEPSCMLNIPNIITPDDAQGSDRNEFFYVDNLDRFPGSSLAIYNRWGTKIYETADYKNTWNGSGHVEGTYYYILTVPASGQVLANVKSTPIAPDIKTKTSADQKVFTGYFQITRLK